MSKSTSKIQLNVGIGLVIFEDQILLLKRESSPVLEYNEKWELPGGKVEFGESFEEGIEREVFEETKLKVKCKYILPFSFSKSFLLNNQKTYVNVICGKCHLESNINSYENGIHNVKWFKIKNLDFNRIIPGSKEFVVWELRDSKIFDELPESARLYEIKMEMIDPKSNKYKNYYLEIFFDPLEVEKFVVKRYFGRIGKSKKKKTDSFTRMNEALEFSQKIIKKRKSHGYSITFIQDNHPLYTWINDKNLPSTDIIQLDLFNGEL